MSKYLCISLFFLLYACDKEEITTTYFENGTDSEFTIVYFEFTRNIKDSLIVLSQSRNKIVAFENNAGKIPPALSTGADSCIIKFKNNNKLIYNLALSPTDKNILLESSYDYNFESTRKADFYNYRYFITQEHLDKAQ